MTDSQIRYLSASFTLDQLMLGLAQLQMFLPGNMLAIEILSQAVNLKQGQL